MRTIYREQLELGLAKGCETPGCPCQGAGHLSEVYLHGRCHPEAGVDVCYRKGSGIVEITCRVCKAPIINVGVALRPGTSVHGLLITSADVITSADEEQMNFVHLAICQVANHIDGRGLTQRYTVYHDDFADVLKACVKQNVTVQEIIGAGDGETYHLHHQGKAPGWQLKKKK